MAPGSWKVFVGKSGFIARVVHSGTQLSEHTHAYPWKDARRPFVNYASGIHKVIFPTDGSEGKT